MRVLVIGAGGVGMAVAKTAARWGLFETWSWPTTTVDVRKYAAQTAAEHFSGVQLDACDECRSSSLIEAQRCDVVMNAIDPRFVMPIYRAAFAAGATYVDMAMSLSRPDPDDPYAKTGVKLGDEQFAMAAQWKERGLLALCGIGVEPGLIRYVRPLRRRQSFLLDRGGRHSGRGQPGCRRLRLRPDLLDLDHDRGVPESTGHLGEGRGWFTTEPFSEPETFDFPAGIGPVECVNVEHEEVLLVPRWVDADRVTFKYGLGDEFIGVFSRPSTSSVSTRPRRSRVGDVEVSPRDVVAGCSRTRRSSVTGCRARPAREPGSQAREWTEAPRGLPAPRGGQRLVHVRVRLPGRGLADGDEPRRGPRATRFGRLVGSGRTRTRGASRRSLPRAPQQPRCAMGVGGADTGRDLKRKWLRGRSSRRVSGLDLDSWRVRQQAPRGTDNRQSRDTDDESRNTKNATQTIRCQVGSETTGSRTFSLSGWATS